MGADLRVGRFLGPFAHLRQIVNEFLDVAQYCNPGFRVFEKMPGDLLNQRRGTEQQHSLRAHGPQNYAAIENPPGGKNNNNEQAAAYHEPGWQDQFTQPQINEERLHQKSQPKHDTDLLEEQNPRLDAVMSIEVVRIYSQ